MPDGVYRIIPSSIERQTIQVVVCNMDVVLCYIRDQKSIEHRLN